MVPHWVSSSTGGEPEAGQASQAVGPQSGKYTVGSEDLLPSASPATGKVKGTAVQHQHHHRLGRCCTLQNEGSGQKDGHSFPRRSSRILNPVDGGIQVKSRWYRALKAK